MFMYMNELHNIKNFLCTATCMHVMYQKRPQGHITQLINNSQQHQSILTLPFQYMQKENIRTRNKLQYANHAFTI